eukprot:4311516-Heterocapsa_arctica.AAC.1
MTSNILRDDMCLAWHVKPEKVKAKDNDKEGDNEEGPPKKKPRVSKGQSGEGTYRGLRPTHEVQWVPFTLKSTRQGKLESFSYSRPVLVDIDEEQSLAIVGEAIRKPAAFDEDICVKAKRDPKLAVSFAVK